MYFINILRLSTRYLKNIIPLDKNLLSEYIKQSESKNNITQINHWLDIISPLNIEFSHNIKKILPVFIPILEVCLSLDAWLGGVDYKILDNQPYLNFFVDLIMQNKNLTQLLEDSLTEENYHVLQQELNLFFKDILKVLTNKPTINYDESIIRNWLKLL
jgi:hypothetical protein